MSYIKYFLLLLGCFLFLIPIHAQLETYDISKFARLELKRKTARLNMNLGFSGDREATDGSYRMSSIGGGVSVFTWFINSKKQQTTASFTGGLALGINNNISGIPNVKGNRNFDPYARGSWNTNYFFKEDWFVGYGIRGDYGYNYRFTSFDNGIENEVDRSFDSFTSIPITIGKGRVEFVTDAWHSLTILEMLKGQGLLLTSMSHDSITAFANEVASIKTARFTDPRHFRINEFERLMDYMISRGYVDPTDYRLFAHVFDAWEFERFVSRRHGQFFSLTLNSSSSYDINQFNRTSESRPALSLLAEYNNYTAKSKDWQLDKSISIAWGPRWRYVTFESSGKFEERNFRTTLRASYTVGYYPSQRTNFSLGFIVFNEIDSFENGSAHNFFFVARPAFTYYISPQFTFEIAGNFSQQENSSESILPIDSYNDLTFKTFYQFY